MHNCSVKPASSHHNISSITQRPISRPARNAVIDDSTPQIPWTNQYLRSSDQSITFSSIPHPSAQAPHKPDTTTPRLFPKQQASCFSQPVTVAISMQPSSSQVAINFIMFRSAFMHTNLIHHIFEK